MDAIKISTDLTAEEYRAIAEEADRRGIPMLGHTTDNYTSVGNGMDGVVHLWGVSATLMTAEDRETWVDGRILSPYAWMQLDKMDELVDFLVDHDAYVNPLLVNEHSGALPEAREYELADYQLLMNPELRYVPLEAMLNWLTFWHKVRSYSTSVGSYPSVETASDEVMDESRRGFRNAQEFVRRFNAAGGRKG